MDELNSLLCRMSLQQQIAFAADCAVRVLHLVPDAMMPVCLEAVRVAHWCAAGAGLQNTAKSCFRAIVASARIADLSNTSAHNAAAAASHAASSAAALASHSVYATKSAACAANAARDCAADAGLAWQVSRADAYLRGEVSLPRPPRPSDLKPYLLSKDRDVRLEAVRVLSALDNSPSVGVQ